MNNGYLTRVLLLGVVNTVVAHSSATEQRANLQPTGQPSNDSGSPLNGEVNCAAECRNTLRAEAERFQTDRRQNCARRVANEAGEQVGDQIRQDFSEHDGEGGCS